MTPFAEMQTAMNAAIVGFLADAVADFGGGVTVSGLFRTPPAEAFGLIGGHRPTFQAHSADLASIAIGTAVSIASESYLVAEKQTESGLTTLVLELA